MIKSFKHKGLELFFTTGNKKGINAAHSKKIKQRLLFLHAAESVDDMDLAGFRLHPLTGDREGLYAVDVSKNWRIVFKFSEGHAYIVNYEDYH